MTKSSKTAMEMPASHFRLRLYWDIGFTAFGSEFAEIFVQGDQFGEMFLHTHSQLRTKSRFGERLVNDAGNLAFLGEESLQIRIIRRFGALIVFCGNRHTGDFLRALDQL